MASTVPIFVTSSQKQGCLPSGTRGEPLPCGNWRCDTDHTCTRDYVNQEDLMKAARKVGDAKKHECTFTHCSRNSPSDPPHSKTRVLGLIMSNASVILCVCRHSQYSFRTPVPTAIPENLFKKVHMNCSPKASTSDRVSREPFRNPAIEKP